MITYNKTKHNAETHREYAKSTITSEVWWVEESDRWIYAAWTHDNKLVSLNFMQGQDTRRDVERHNEELVAFYNCIISNFFQHLDGEDIDLRTIDEICWAYNECDVIFKGTY